MYDVTVKPQAGQRMNQGEAREEDAEDSRRGNSFIPSRNIDCVPSVCWVLLRQRVGFAFRCS